MSSSVSRAAAELYGSAKEIDSSIITEADIASMPYPVQRYMRFAGVVGARPVQHVEVRFKGSFRTSPSSEFSPLDATEWYDAAEPSFVFYGKVGASYVGQLRIFEMLSQSVGSLRLEAWPGIRLADKRGATLNVDQADRYLNEMTWFPTAYLDPRISWETIDYRSARATLRLDGIEVSAVMRFAEDGRMTEFEGKKHFGADGTLSGKERVLTEWKIVIDGYDRRGDFQVPVQGSGFFVTPKGEFEYIRVTSVDSISFDSPRPASKSYAASRF